jgi:hypothetical protein
VGGVCARGSVEDGTGGGATGAAGDQGEFEGGVFELFVLSIDSNIKFMRQGSFCQLDFLVVNFLVLRGWFLRIKAGIISTQC